MFKVRRVPWKNKDEWLRVYEKAFDTSEINNVEEALGKMEEWIKRGNCPPAVEYTHKFMLIMNKDPHFFPVLSNHADESHLQLQYATSLLRFINILGEVESIKSLSLNARALKAGLPEWVVNIRHQISHGTALPSLDILRLSVASLVDWLRDNYWKVEQKSMNDLVLPDRLNTLKDKFTQLIKVYEFLKNSCSNDETVRLIQNHDMKQKILTLNSIQYYTFKKETSPWDQNDLPGLYLLHQPKKLLKCKVDYVTNLVIRSIKMYFEHESPVLVSKYLAHIMLENNFKIDAVNRTWEQLIASLHSKALLTPLIFEFVDLSCQQGNPSQKDAAGWTIHLMKSLFKRMKVERKLLKMSSSSVPSSKRMRLNLNEKEKRVLSMEGIKHQLSFESSVEGLKVEILPNLFKAIEKANPSLKLAMRLPEPKFFTEREILDILLKLFENPNEFVKPITKALLAMSTTISSETVSNLMIMTKLKETPLKINRFGRCSLYDSSLLASRFGMQTNLPSKISKLENDV